MRSHRTALLVLVTLIGAGVSAGLVAGHPGGTAAGAHPGATGPQVKRTIVPAATDTPLELAGNHPVIQVMIDGKGPYRFLVDTGASHSVIDSSLAEELGLKSRGEMRMGDPMNPDAIVAQQVELPSLEIGGAKFEGVFAASWNQSKMFPAADPPRGVVGFSVFKDVLVTFDYADRKFAIAPGSLPAVDGKKVIPFTMPDGIPQFEIAVGGVRMQAHLDTGSGGFFSLPKAMRDSVRFQGPLVEVGHGHTVNSEFAILGGTLDGSLQIAGFAYDHPFIETTDVLPMPNLGSKALTPFALTFDQRAHTMRFDAKAPLKSPVAPKGQAQLASAPGRGAPPPPPSGMRFAVGDGEAMSVYDVAPDSPAARAGVTAGEDVVAINGKPAMSYDDDARRAALRSSPVTLTLRKDGKTHDVTITF
jgi:predicted aspartyl protease